MPKTSPILLAAFTAASAASSALASPGPSYSIAALNSGNFSVSSIAMSPTNNSLTEWGEGESAHVRVMGKTSKDILAGTFKYQIYETGVKSFISSGNSPYFKCDNKGCDTSSPIALKWVGGEAGSSGSGNFELTLTAALPKKVSSSNEFRLVLWGEDQDHFPYDFTATLDFKYGSSDGQYGEKRFGPDGEKRYGPGGTQHMFGPGGTQPLEPKIPPQFAVSGAVGEDSYGPGGTQHMFGPGGTQPLEPTIPPQFALSGPVPWACTMLQKKLCGKCSMNDSNCWITCVRKHAKQLRKVCKLTDIGRVVNMDEDLKDADEATDSDPSSTNAWSFLFGKGGESTSNLRHVSN